MRERYIKDGEGFLLVYSITEKSTFLTVKNIYSRIDKIKDAGGQPIPVILVGNKVNQFVYIPLNICKVKNITSLYLLIHCLNFCHSVIPTCTIACRKHVHVHVDYVK